MLPTVAEILQYPEVRRGHPQVCAGALNLHRPVVWVHVIELPDITGLLSGGELILSTGIGLPENATELQTYIRQLADVGVAALVVELGQRFSMLPDALVAAAEECGLPLIMLRTVIRFVAVTQAVHANILQAQMREIAASDEAHRAFNALTIACRGPQDVVDLVAEMSGRAVVYESFSHQVLAFNCAARDPDSVLDDWERRSRATDIAGESGDTECWAAVQIAATQGGAWGRLVMLSDAPLTGRERMILDRGGTALVINRLTDRDLEQLHRETYRTLLTALALSPDLPKEATARARALGVPMSGKTLTGVVLLLDDDTEMLPASVRDLATSAADFLRGLGVAALVGSLDDCRVAILLSGPVGVMLTDVLDTLADRSHQLVRRSGIAARLIIGVGKSAQDAEGGQRSLREALQIAASAHGLADRSFYTRSDLRLRSLTFPLRDHPAVHSFVERELGVLLAHDAANGSTLVDFLTVYCRCGGNKTAAANALYVSRAALYDRIAKVEHILAVDLSDPETLLALHFAIIARESMARPTLALGAARIHPLGQAVRGR